MAERRRYTKSQKAHAVSLALLTSVEAAAEAEGVPRTTLDYWMDRPEFVELRNKTRDAVADEMWTAVQVGLREVVKGLSGDAPLRDKSVALGILYDKHALLTGAATSRSESRDLTPRALSDHETEALTRAIEGYLDGSGGPDADAARHPEGQGVSALSE
jgi:transposase-like protein